MPVASGVYVLGLLALVAILLAGIAISVTVRSGAGTALAVLLVVVAAAGVASILWHAPLEADPAGYLASHPFAGIGTAFTEVVDQAFFCVASVAALVVAAISRHWGWLAGIVAATLPMVALALGGLIPSSPSTYARDVIPFSAALFCPPLSQFRVCHVAAPHSAACRLAQLVRSGRRDTAFS